jgi:hypothetical protein
MGSVSSFDLITHLFSTDVSLGTLWRVKESVWKDKLPSFYVAKEKTKMHPGLSISKYDASEADDVIPLLHGTTSPKGPVVVKGISNDNEKYKENHKCSFGQIIFPALIPKKKMEEFDRSTTVFDPGLGPKWTEEFDVIPNRYKPRITSKEREQLDSYLKRKKAEDG